MGDLGDWAQHQFVIFETDKFYYSIEKDNQYITLQREENFTSLPKLQNGKERLYYSKAIVDKCGVQG